MQLPPSPLGGGKWTLHHSQPFILIPQLRALYTQTAHSACARLALALGLDWASDAVLCLRPPVVRSDVLADEPALQEGQGGDVQAHGASNTSV